QAAAPKGMPFKEQMTVFKRLLMFMTPFKGQFIGGIFFGIVLELTNAILPRIIQIFIDDQLTPTTATVRTIWVFSSVYFGFTLLNFVAWYLTLYLFNMASERSVKNMRESLYTKIHTLGMRFFDQTSSGWIITRVTNDTEAMKDFWEVFLTILQGVFGFVTS